MGLPFPITTHFLRDQGLYLLWATLDSLIITITITTWTITTWWWATMFRVQLGLLLWAIIILPVWQPLRRPHSRILTWPPRRPQPRWAVSWSPQQYYLPLRPVDSLATVPKTPQALTVTVIMVASEASKCPFHIFFPFHPLLLFYQCHWKQWLIELLLLIGLLFTHTKNGFFSQNFGLSLLLTSFPFVLSVHLVNERSQSKSCTCCTSCTDTPIHSYQLNTFSFCGRRSTPAHNSHYISPQCLLYHCIDNPPSIFYFFFLSF